MIKKTEVNDFQCNQRPLDMSTDWWSLCRCVIIPWKDTAALTTGESATDGALACYLHCRWDTCGDSISPVPLQRQTIDPKQGLQQSLHQMTHCKSLCVNESGLLLFLSETKKRQRKNETQSICKQKQQNAKYAPCRDSECDAASSGESVSVREKGRENERETEIRGRKGAASITASVPAGS